MKPAKQKKNTKYYLKKAAVSAVGAVAAASLLVNGLFPSAREITAGLPETPPAIVQVCEPELPEEEQEEKAPEGDHGHPGSNRAYSVNSCIMIHWNVRFPPFPQS